MIQILHLLHIWFIHSVIFIYFFHLYVYFLISSQEIEAMGQEFFDHVVFLTPRGTVVVIVYNE